jgi:hypothetical protein
MIAKVLDICEGTSLSTEKYKRTFVKEMRLLVGEYISVKDIKDNWFAMEYEFEDMKFVFHGDWLKFDDREDSDDPIILEAGEHFTRTEAGLIGISDLNKICGNVLTEIRESNIGLRIRWPSLVPLANSAPHRWCVWLADGKPLDQRYREYVNKKYGVQVPDSICINMAKLAKSAMSKQVQANVTVRKVTGEDVINANVVIGETNVMLTARRLHGWLIFDVQLDETAVLQAFSAVICALGKDKYTWGTIRVSGYRKIGLCIYRSNERGPLATIKYKMEA